MKVLIESATWNDEQIKLIEEKYKAKYVMDSCLGDGNGGWLNFPVSVFYTETPHPEGSNYFAFYKHPLDSKTMITNGYSAIKDPIEGILIDDTIIYSRYRHDCKEYRDVFIDGGRDYTRIGGDDMFRTKRVMLEVIKGKIKIHFDDHLGKGII